MDVERYRFNGTGGKETKHTFPHIFPHTVSREDLSRGISPKWNSPLDYPAEKTG